MIKDELEFLAKHDFCSHCGKCVRCGHTRRRVINYFRRGMENRVRCSLGKVKMDG